MSEDVERGKGQGGIHVLRAVCSALLKDIPSVGNGGGGGGRSSGSSISYSARNLRGTTD